MISVFVEIEKRIQGGRGIIVSNIIQRNIGKLVDMNVR